MTADTPTPTTDDREPSLRNATLSDVTARRLPRPESITAVIRHHVRPDAAAAYEQWLQRIVPIAERFPGHRGVHVIHPPAGSTLYTVTIRFDSLLHADDWFQSAARHALLDEVLPMLDSDEEVKTVTGLEFWFQPAPGQKPARRYKQPAHALRHLPAHAVRAAGRAMARRLGAGAARHLPLPLRHLGHRRGTDDLCADAPHHTARGRLALSLTGDRALASAEAAPCTSGIGPT